MKVTLHVEMNDYDLVALIRLAGMKGVSLEDLVYEALKNYIDSEFKKLATSPTTQGTETPKEQSGGSKSEGK